MHKLENRGEWMTQQRGRSSHSPRSLAASAEHGSATAERADTGWFEGTRRHGWWRLGGEARSPDWSWLSAFGTPPPGARQRIFFFLRFLTIEHS